MLRRVKEKITMLNDKQLIDTFYCIGKLHKEDRSHYAEFFNYLLEDFTKEISERLKYLESPHIAYLCKGLKYLNYSDEKLTLALED